MKYTYTAVLIDGFEVRAEKKSGKWLVGGDYDLSSLAFIRRSDGTQFALKGNRLIKQ